MNNMDVLDEMYQVAIVKHFVNGKLVECRGIFQDIDSYKVIQSKIGSISGTREDNNEACHRSC